MRPAPTRRDRPRPTPTTTTPCRSRRSPSATPRPVIRARSEACSATASTVISTREDSDDTRRQVPGDAAVCRTTHRPNRRASRARQCRDQSRPFRDLSRQHVAAQTEPYGASATSRRPATTVSDRQTTGERDTSRYVERLEREVEMAKDERDFLPRADRPQGQDHRLAAWSAIARPTFWSAACRI